MSLFIRTFSITFVFLIILILYSCGEKTRDNKNNLNTYINKNNIYKVVDSIDNSSDRFSKTNIYTMGYLYKNKYLQEMLKKDAYSGVDDYFLDLFLKKNKIFYAYVFEIKDSVILYNIRRNIYQYLDLSTDYYGNLYIDSIYNSHLKNNIDKKILINYMFYKSQLPHE